MNRYQLPDDTDTVGGLAEHLVDKFQLSQRAGGLRLLVDGYALLPDAALSIIRDGDLMCIAATALALPSAAAAGRKRKLARESNRPAKKRCNAAQPVLLVLKAKSAQGPPPSIQAAPSEQSTSSADTSLVASGGCFSAACRCLHAAFSDCNDADSLRLPQMTRTKSRRSRSRSRGPAGTHAGKLPRGGSGGRASCHSRSAVAARNLQACRQPYRALILWTRTSRSPPQHPCRQRQPTDMPMPRHWLRHRWLHAAAV